MSYFIDPDIYEQYRDEVLALSNSIQINLPEHIAPEKRKPHLTDREIGERLGLDEAIVREIRCVAEREYYSLEEWQRALTFKERACRDYADRGLSSVTLKYIKKKSE